jgi:hypothetical protein
MELERRAHTDRYGRLTQIKNVDLLEPQENRHALLYR